MLSSLFYRICVFCINLVFPPAAVMIVAGLGMDVVVNCILLLLGVIPAHVHGFYLSFTYSHRRHKVKKGKYPGGPKPLVYSDNVINGGASAREVDRLYREQCEGGGRAKYRG